ncbi:response regulator [Rhizobium sp. FY34]|uniref:response regulator n=1 Tax=Rhizobium sp. FY34 TaxID=2562309 RepID=UPI0010C112AE|nr:response regulator [Rhizobium sp. FY34]
MSNPRIPILVVEDVALISMRIVDDLEQAGFTVFEAASSAQAVEALIANETIQLLFTDVGMPGGIDGLKLVATVRDRWPAIKIIVTSGHRKVDVALLPVEARFMAKPYDPVAVILSIREMTAL